MVTLSEYQTLIKGWHDHNFPIARPGKAERVILKIGEELGELNRAYINKFDGIKGTKAHWVNKACDAIGDIILATLVYCNEGGYSINECLTLSWDELRDEEKLRQVWDEELKASSGRLPSSPEEILIRALCSAASIGHVYYALRDDNWEGWADATKLMILRLIILLALYCLQAGFDIERCIADSWEEVKGRDFSRSSSTENQSS
jgi:NTP pyrophosphatase (non-canonical NTP hydrolase)